MKELFFSWFSNSFEKIKSPFLGSYISSFVIFNWQPIFILLFSDRAMEERILSINTFYVAPKIFWIPAGIAILYVLSLPWINVIIETLLFKVTRHRTTLNSKAVIFDLNLQKEKVRTEKQLADIRAGLQDLTNLNNQLEQVKNEKQQALDEIKNLSDRNLSLNEENLKLTEKLKNEFSFESPYSKEELSDFKIIGDLIKKNKLGASAKILRQFYDGIFLDKLILKGHIIEDDEFGNKVYKLTNDGAHFHEAISTLS